MATVEQMPKTRHPLYSTWVNMVDRCCNPASLKFPFYGGRGIKLCERWRISLADFAADIESAIGPKPSRSHTLDRVDNDGDYVAGNVRWATRQVQASNTRKAVRVTLNGETLCLSDWARRFGIAPSTLRTRLKRTTIEAIYLEKLGVEVSGAEGRRDLVA